MKVLSLILLMTLFSTPRVIAQDTIKYIGLAGDKLLYESIELYADKTFTRTSEYDLNFSSFGEYKLDEKLLILNFYIDWQKPNTMSLKDTIEIINQSIRSDVYIMDGDKMYRTDKQGKKIKRIKDKSFRTNWSWLFGHKYYLIRMD